MAELRLLCPISELSTGGAAPFQGVVRGELRPCVAVRASPTAEPVAFVNICAHRNQPVVVNGYPFDAQGRIECRAHGAIYDPASGECVEGPCIGGRLVMVPLVEKDGLLYAVDDDVVDDSAYADE